MENSSNAGANRSKRAPNFSDSERILLMDLLNDPARPFKKVIECKKTDAVSSKQKDAAWQDVAQQFNACTSSAARNPSHLMTAWRNLKTRGKKYSAARRRETFRTGGCPPPKEDELSARFCGKFV
ncbi:myb/SANT-like DNA-binding domain-containing protein 3, partial [Ciona intestinalis]